MQAWILVDGRLKLGGWLPAAPTPDLVVAADGGLRHAETLGVEVDAWVGDFDSSAGLASDAPRETHPRAKDQTDFELALALAKARGATAATVWGAFGGRFDHSLALALSALRETAGGFPVTLQSGDEAGYPLLAGQQVAFEARPGQTVSVLAVDDLRGLSISGLRWPLAGASVPSGSGWTVSNEAVGGMVTAGLSAGRALVLVQAAR